MALSLENNTFPTQNVSDVTLPPWASVRETIITVDMLMILPICFGNILVLLAIKRTNTLRTMANIPLVNLAITDLVTGCVSIPMMCFNNYWTYGSHNKWRCLILFPFIHVPIGVSGLTMFFIALLRFLAVRFPLKYKKTMSRFRCKMLFVGTWLYLTCLLTLYIFFGNQWEKNSSQNCTFIDVMPKGYMVILASHIILVGVICAAIYTYIGIKVIKRGTKLDHMVKGKWSERKLSRAMDRQTSSNKFSNCDIISYVQTDQTNGIMLSDGKTSDNESSVDTNENIDKYESGKNMDKYESGNGSHLVDNIIKKGNCHSVINGAAKDIVDKDNKNSSLVDKQQSTPKQRTATINEESLHSQFSQKSIKKKHFSHSISLGHEMIQDLYRSPTKKHFSLSDRHVSINSNLGHTANKKDALKKMKYAKTIRMLVMVLVTFYLCWVPFLLKVLIGIIMKPPTEPEWLSIFGQFAVSAFFANSFLNPLIYAGMDLTFRKAFMKILGMKEEKHILTDTAKHSSSYPS